MTPLNVVPQCIVASPHLSSSCTSQSRAGVVVKRRPRNPELFKCPVDQQVWCTMLSALLADMLRALRLRGHALDVLL